MTTSTPKEKVALVTGANGYIGRAVARAFRRAGYTTYGLIRSASAADALQRESIVPIIGSAADPKAVLSALSPLTPTLDVIASTTEDTTDYISHFNNNIGLLHMLAATSTAHSVRPLVLFTSGCKDYGRGLLDGSPNLHPHTEETPLNPPDFLINRAKYAPEILKEKSFDAAVLRPTHVHGYSSSYFGKFFEVAADAKRNGMALTFRADPNAILHSMHVDDCGEAYVALADPSKREEVSGQCFNISPGKRYETLRDVGEALVRTYDIHQGLVFDTPAPKSHDGIDIITNFSQWVGSGKIRSLTEWVDKRPMFAEGIERYRREYEKAVQEEDDNVARVQGRDWQKSAKAQAKAAGSAMVE